MRQQLVELLLRGSHSTNELAAATGESAGRIRRFINSQDVHIASWAQDTRGYWRVKKFRWGTGVDAVKPTPKTAAERMAKSRAG